MPPTLFPPSGSFRRVPMSSLVPTPQGLAVVLCPPLPPLARFFQMMSCKTALEGGERVLLLSPPPTGRFLPGEATRKPHLLLLYLTAFHTQMFGWVGETFTLPSLETSINPKTALLLLQVPPFPLWSSVPHFSGMSIPRSS